MMNADLKDAHKGVEITLGKKTPNPRPVNTKTYFIRKANGKKK
jgi:hypothetical protein